MYKIHNDVGFYIDSMKQIHKSIMDIQGQSFIINHKKTLLFSLIETLSKTAYPNKGNKDKFINFISNFCLWEDYNRVSIQQLKFYLDKLGTNLDTSQIQSYSDLNSFIERTLSTFPKSSPVQFSCDPTIEEINSYLPASQGNINGKKLTHFTHGSLMWNFRNALVHESRGLGTNEMFEHEQQPHYVPFSYIDYLDGNVSVSDKYFVICYPIMFLNTLIYNGIVNLEKYLISNSKNPYDAFILENLWVD